MGPCPSPMATDLIERSELQVTPRSSARLGILADFAEEQWPSMDLCAETLARNLANGKLVRPSFRRIASRLSANRFAFNADRLVNRLLVYPRLLKRRRHDYDAFHIVDHSYSHLVHGLPANRTGVYCHDLDAFRCVIEPGRDRRPSWFRRIAKRILRGLQKAAIVFHSTAAVRDEILHFGLIDPRSLVHAPYGVAAEFSSAGSQLTIPWLKELDRRP